MTINEQRYGRALRKVEGPAIIKDFTLLGARHMAEMSDSETRSAEHALLAAKVRNAVLRECQAIATAGNPDLAASLERDVLALSYDQLLRLRRAILGA